MTHDTNRPALPWWRVRMVWLVVGGPAVVVVASFVTLVLAVQLPPEAARTLGPGAHSMQFRIAQRGPLDEPSRGSAGATAGVELREKSTFVVPR